MGSQFVPKGVECIISFDSEGFSIACPDYNKITKLDPWTTCMLQQIKKTIAGETIGEGEDEVGDDDFNLPVV